MKVLILAENFRYDQRILKPLIEAMFRRMGKPSAKVQVCTDPLLGSYEQATNWQRLAEIFPMYRKIDLFLLIVDRDGKVGRQQTLIWLEEQARAVLMGHRCFFAVSAVEEIEVWALAGLPLRPQWQWSSIRTDLHPKDNYFVPLAESRRLPDLARCYKEMGDEAAASYPRIRQLCPEIADLEQRIVAWMNIST